MRVCVTVKSYHSFAGLPLQAKITMARADHANELFFLILFFISNSLLGLCCLGNSRALVGQLRLSLVLTASRAHLVALLDVGVDERLAERLSLRFEVPAVDVPDGSDHKHAEQPDADRGSPAVHVCLFLGLA